MDGDSRQTPADAQEAIREEYCSVYTDIYEDNIRIAKDQIAYNEGILAVDRPALESTLVSIEQNEEKLAGLKAEKERAKNQRDEEHETWATYDAEYEDSISAVYEAIEIVKDLQYSTKGSELIQIRLTDIQARIAKSMSKYQNNLYGPSVAALAQIATSADQSTVARIIELLEALADDLTVASQEDTDSENQKQADWEQYDSDLDAAIADTERLLESLYSKKASLELSISTAEENLANAQKSKAENEALLDELTNQCAAWKIAYIRTTQERSEELESVDQVTELVTEELVGMEGYLNERVNA